MVNLIKASLVAVGSIVAYETICQKGYSKRIGFDEVKGGIAAAGAWMKSKVTKAEEAKTEEKETDA